MGGRFVEGRSVEGRYVEGRLVGRTYCSEGCFVEGRFVVVPIKIIAKLSEELLILKILQPKERKRRC
jgi:hypothetical protein